jgi:hypothetical protein
MPTFRLTYPCLAGVLACLALGCQSGGDSGPTHPVGGSGALLTQAQGCDDLLNRLQDDGLAKVEMRAQQYMEWYASDGDRWGPTVDAGVADGAEPPSFEGPEDHSDTNVQVEGVDEADIVKTDGTHIYVLSGDQLFLLQSWPADQTSLEGSLSIEGYGQEMFVADGRAVVFSSTLDPGDDAGSPGYCSPELGAWSGLPDACYGTGFTKITVADLTGEQPAVERELYIEGSYRSSRRHDATVRAVLQNWGLFHGLGLPDVWSYLSRDGEDFYELSTTERRRRIREWHADATAAVRGTTLDDWLPRMIDRQGEALAALPPRCEGFYVPRPGMADDGITQIVGLDMVEASAPPDRTAIWGNADHVYANHDAMVLAQADYTAAYMAREDGAEQYTDRTVLHRFALGDTGGTTYEASGFVPGTLANQFSMDERDGVVRVATTQTTWDAWWLADEPTVWTPPSTANQMLPLRVDPESGELAIQGTTGPLAEDERIFSARFMGDLAYMVTFRQVDPLFAIDLSDPANPRVLGELKIPGFSDYMHPLGDGHLLTIGKDADETTGEIFGLALQIFDVTDPTEPDLKHKHVFTDAWGHSEANWNHKAFTYFASRGLLAFPYVAWSQDWTTHRSSLEVFAVDAEDGFTEMGSVDHTDLVEDLCDPTVDFYCSTHAFQVRRGIFIEDYVYSISFGGVRVNHVEDLTTDVATVVLP